MADPALPVSPEAPIGVFDSGIGGLSVLRHVHALLPAEELLYFSDAGFSPYGEKPESVIVERALAITNFLLRFRIKAIVVACNTATAAAIAALRASHPQLQVVGVEPGLKPAAQLTQSRKVGVLATAGTLSSDKFLRLREQVTRATQVDFHLQACNGLADQIEKGELASRDTKALVQRYVAPLVARDVDTLVLGCTHYPFVEPLVREAAGPDVRLVDTGEPVARQLERLLRQRGLLRPESAGAGGVSAYTTGSRSALANAFRRLLELDPPVEAVSVA